MRTLTLLTTALLTTLVGAQALAAPVVCTQGNMTRSIEVVYSDPGQAVPCEVLYDKSSEGAQSTPWRATNESGYCEAKAAQLVAKLEGLGWTCATQSAPESAAPASEEPPADA
jgi:hypothetical protein